MGVFLWPEAFCSTRQIGNQGLCSRHRIIWHHSRLIWTFPDPLFLGILMKRLEVIACDGLGLSDSVCTVWGGFCENMCWIIAFWVAPASEVLSSVPVGFIDICVVVCSEGTHGPTPPPASGSAPGISMSWLVIPSLPSVTHPGPCGRQDKQPGDGTGGTGSWEINSSPKGQNVCCAKNTWPQCWSHVSQQWHRAITWCWMGGAVVAALLGELRWPGVCPGSVGSRNISKVGSQGRAWGWSHPISEGLRCCLTREMWWRFKDPLGYGGAHHPNLWVVSLTQGCHSKGCSPALERTSQAGSKGLWGNKTPLAQHFVPKLHWQQSFHFSIPYDFWFNSFNFWWLLV